MRIARDVFPNNTDFLFLKYLIKLVQLENASSNLLNDLLSENASLDHVTAAENTQNNDDYLKVLVVKLLVDVHSYDKAQAIFSDITDMHALSMVSDEEKIFTHNNDCNHKS